MNEGIGIIVEYENILLGNARGFSNAYLHKGIQKKNIRLLLQYIFESILEWEPEMIRDYLNDEIIDKLHIRNLIKRLDFPPELNSEREYFYVAMALYPDKIAFPKRTYILSIYQKVLEHTLVRFPKKFFMGNAGKLNCNICFRYALQQNMYMDNLYDLYMYFSNEKQGVEFIRKSLLYAPYNAFYDNPVDLLHDCLPEEQQSELLYQLALFNLKSRKDVKR